MPTLYVTEPGATVRFSGGSFHVTVERATSPDTRLTTQKLLLNVEPHRLELIGLVGRVHITVDALQLCLSKGIGVSWFSWNGRFLGRMVPEEARSGDLRMAQYRAMVNPKTSLGLARAVVLAKCANAASVLRGIQSNQSGLEDVSLAIRELAEQRERIPVCTDSETLMGHEGRAASRYFAVLGRGFRGDIGFTRRQRRPPPDPANALLSFGYVLLSNLIGGHLEARGLDPAIGFFHAPRPGRASLALDLLEEFRHPVVDRFVMRACNLRTIQSKMFENDSEQRGVRLTRDGLKHFFKAWGEHLERSIQEVGGAKLSPARLVRRQVNRMAMTVRGDEPYQPFLFQD